METVDMHCDTMSRLWKLEAGGMKEELSVNSGHVDMEKLRKGGYLLQNFALFVEKEKCDDPWEQVLNSLLKAPDSKKYSSKKRNL